ncbi:MAG: HD domain-containing protein [Oscillospiraceae bacterium]|nr:HD domain-containing protein [Oscillospiraceae bacterium]
MERLKKQMEFLLELDKMKNLYRQTYIINDYDRHSGESESPRPPRKENDAEHSFHLAIFAVILSEYSNVPIDLLKVIKMVLIHDVVEIDAGDTYCYDTEANKTKRDREVKAADRLFGLLPDDQQKEFRDLWEEFEAENTPEAKFAVALDRMQPMLMNYTKDGKSWKEHGVHYDSVISRNSKISNGAEELWAYMKPLIDKSKEDGLLL